MHLKQHLIIIFFVLICLTAPSFSIFTETGPEYVPLNQLALKYGLRHERDPITGRETFSGNGYQMTLCAGMSSVMINNKLTFLDNEAKIVDGKIAVPSNNFTRIATMLKEYSQQEQDRTEENNTIKKVVLDAGHGGIFRGARGKNGLLEKQITLDVAKRLKKILEEKDITVIMTRERDANLAPSLDEDLQRRIDIANREQPDLFISIHANWCSDSSVRGFEIYYCEEKPVSNHKIKLDRINQSDDSLDNDTKKVLNYVLRDEYKKETQDLAEEIKDAFEKLNTPDRGIRNARFKVIKKTECPSLLVEMDYLSNKTACHKLATTSYRQQIAEKLGEAILNYQTIILKNERFTK
ncbi:MAG: N-acetylmuramoyl-L-alanine amidase [Planctomycetota bacterium]